MKRYLLGGVIGLVVGGICGIIAGPVVLFLSHALRILPRSNNNDEMIMIGIFVVVGTVVVGVIGLIAGLIIAALKKPKN